MMNANLNIQMLFRGVLVLLVAFSVGVAEAAKSSPKRRSTAKVKRVAKKPAAATPQKKGPKCLGCISESPYRAALVFDETGRVYFEHRADEKVYPASTLKLMTLLVIQRKLERREMTLDQLCEVSTLAASQAPSGVALKRGESFPVRDLLYAIMIKSANDAAVCLAEAASGTVGAFVDEMNAEARRLGMNDTLFQSPNGLPPRSRGKGGVHDRTTARDMMKLCLELCEHPAVFKYTSCARRAFGSGARAVNMVSHNPFLTGKRALAGCDGLKTGYTLAAGCSICLSVNRDGRRYMVLVMDSNSGDERNDSAQKLVDQYVPSFAESK